MVKDNWQTRFEAWKADKRLREQGIKSNKESKQESASSIIKTAERDLRQEARLAGNFLKEEEKKVEKFVEKEEQEIEKIERAHPTTTKLIKILAILIPIVIILVILYLNFLPFGYAKSYTIIVNENGTIESSDSNFYLETANSKKLSTLSSLSSYGSINLIFHPKLVLRNAKISISLIGNEIYFPLANPNDKINRNWDYFWNFSKSVPTSLTGNVYYDLSKKCAYFDAEENTTLSFPNSKNMFENSSFILYSKFMPTNIAGRGQQIIGHYNWELWQNNNSITFMVGRLENKTGSMPSITYKIADTEAFFNNQHEAIAIYFSDKTTNKGFIELYVDNNLAGRKLIGKGSIWKDYNSNRDLTFGWSPHNYGNNSYFSGCLYEAGFDYINRTDIVYSSNYSFTSSPEQESIKLPIIGFGNLTAVNLIVNQEGFL